ncbi:DUF262 domain-containing protein [bacterium]|nr:DUF262 domain-containing protein [bacterium]
MELNTEIWPLVSLIHNKKNINPTPEYQRYSVWNTKQQQLLMDSIFRGMDIPKLYLRKTASGSDFKYEAVDGQQRMRTIWGFYNNEFSLNKKFTPELGGKKYDDLEMDERQKFDMFNFSVVIIRESSDEEIREMFCRLQNGKPLNAAEKRNAMVSKVRDFVAKLVEHPFFKDSIKFSNSRMQHQQAAAQTILLECHGKPVSVRSADLNKFYLEQVDFNDTGKIAKKVQKVYDFLNRSFPEPIPEFKRGWVLPMFMLVSRLMDEFNLNGKEHEFQTFLIEFEARRHSEADSTEMLKFEQNMSHSSDGEPSLKYRHEMLNRELHAYIPNLIPIDSQRGFDEAQRVAIYRRDGGECKYCGAEVPWDDFHADHIVPHSKGGPTTVQNGWLACSKCNQSKGVKSAVSLA